MDSLNANRSEPLAGDSGASTTTGAATPTNDPRPTESSTETPAGRRTVPRLGTARHDYSSLVWFGGSLLVLVGALMLEVRDGVAVGLIGTDWTLPETCSLRGRFGVDCPGCGLTRSFIHIAHGEWAGAWGLHWVAPIIFAYVVIQLPLAIWYGIQSFPQRRSNSWYRNVIWYNERFLVVIALLLVFRWVVMLSTGG